MTTTVTQPPRFVATSRFEIVRHIGSGGMGSVYEAIDCELGARVALKRLDGCEPEQLVRFKREFRDFQNLSHPNLVTLRELFSDGAQWFFSMELLDGVNFLEYVRPSVEVEEIVSLDGTTTSTDSALTPTTGVPSRRRSGPQVCRRRVPGPLDERRLRCALPQLAIGIQALHDAGKLHRDIKPSNVLVTRDERVVLVDYGVAVDLQELPHARRLTGTVAYMAPEQAACRPTGRAADWYAFGGMLYEALTGRRPHDGKAEAVIEAKQRLDVSMPRDVEPAAPRDLSTLCEDLLKVDPSARPCGADVLARLGVEATSERRSPRPIGFVGRRAQLSALNDAYKQSREHAKLVLVYGESGVGKSALVRYFVDELRRSDPRVMALTGICYERESVPYKAFDGIIDALGQQLERLPEAEARRLLPDHIALVAHAFPVLLASPAIRAAAARHTSSSIDPREQRSRVFSALRALLQQIGEAGPVVVTIDDLQWADADSLALLSALILEPGAPRLLLVATVRTDDAKRESLARTQLEPIVSDASMLPVERLSPAEARALAEQLVRDSASSRELDPEVIARAADGHPLFLDALVRHASVATDASDRMSLAEALWARVMQVDATPRRVLELVCLSGGRLQQQAAAIAAGISLGELANQVAILRVAHLLRTSGMRGIDHVEPYHGHVRAAVLSHIEAATSLEHHHRLAVALEMSGQLDPDALAIHWREAGNREKASHFALMAAEKADRALAFDRAVQFYRHYLELNPKAPRDIRVRLGSALANSGRGHEAAHAFLAAAKDASAREAQELRRRAAEQLLRSGHIDEGLTVLRDVLAAVGMQLAPSPMRALISLLGRRARISLRGLGYREREESQVAPEELNKIDTCWAAAACLSMVDTIRGADFQARHLLLALAAGEPYRVSRALALEGGFQSLAGRTSATRAATIIDRASALATRIGNPHAIGLARMILGIAAFQASRWRTACEQLSAAEALLRDNCTGVAWELTSIHVFHLNATYYVGRLAELQRRVPTLIKEAQARDDRYAAIDLRLSNLNSVWLAQDDVDAAREAAREAMSHLSPGGYLDQHFYALMAETNIDLYANRGPAAYQRVLEQWPAIKKSMMLRIQSIRVVAVQARAYAAVVAARSGDSNMLSLAERDAATLAKEGVEWATAFAAAIQAAVCAARGKIEDAVQLLSVARAHFETAEMPLSAAACSHHIGMILGGDEGHAMTRHAEDTLAAQNIRHPVRFAQMLVPGFTT